MDVLKTVFTIAFLLSAGIWDLLGRRIPNNLVISAAISSLALSSLRGTSFLILSLKGMAFGLGLGLLPFVLGMMGGGDVKSLGVLGSLTGVSFLWKAFFGALAAGGVFGVLLLLPPHARRRSVHLAESGPPHKPGILSGFLAKCKNSMPFTSILSASALALILTRAF